MRGARISKVYSFKQCRIIPADAGSTSTPAWPTLLRWDHPRGCGEHLVSARSLSWPQGSSPRMRGAQRVLDHTVAVRGIIPADAGSTSRHTDDVHRQEDHPRGCGEHMATVAPWPLNSGSSPRMRGAPVQQDRRIPQHGIIPADAGSTTSIESMSCLGSDHPRGCGEHSDTPRVTWIIRGSSPRMRGALQVEERMVDL